MRLFSTGPALPGLVRSAVPDRPLAAAESSDGHWLVGSRERFHAVAADGNVEVALRWEQVQRADWDQDTATLRVERVEDYGRPVTTYSFVVPEPGPLLPLVRERVSASVLLQRRVELRRRRGLTVIARRAPSGRGEVLWAFELDPGVDPADPAVMEAAQAALRDARESLGL